MTINDFALACAVDNSPPYFTYHNETMLIIQSKENSQNNINSFEYIEPFIESLVSHESIHVVMKRLESADISDCLDDIEVIITRNGSKYQVTLNNMFFASDSSGIVLP